jgi:hypothetical protein
MAAKEPASWTTRLGGNRALVLGLVILLLVLFTVDAYVLPAFGVGGSGEDHVRFLVGGRTVSLGQGRFQATLQDWQRYQQGVRLTTGIPRGQPSELLEDLMIAELARDAGLSIPDEAVRSFVRNHPLFQDARGEFSARKFDDALATHYGGLAPRAFEDQVRLHLLVDHFRKVYAASFLQVADEDVFRKWKADHPKVAVAYTWAPVGPVRDAMGPSDLEEGAVEEYWKSSLVQRRHILPRRFTFTAAFVRPSSVDDAAYAKAREETKGEAALSFTDEEAYEHWFRQREYAFVVTSQTDTTLKALRAENEARVNEEDAKRKAETPALPKEGGEAPEPDLWDQPPESLSDREQYRRYWRHRVEKELWLKKVMEGVLSRAKEGTKPLEELAREASRPGVEIRVHAQADPVDQYGVEKIEGLGGPNAPIRWAINQKGADDAGKVHPELLEATASGDALAERGWLIFRTDGVVLEQVPPLDAVRDKVTAELLDQRAREKVRAGLDAFRKFAEDSRKGLVEAAKEKGLPSETTEAFHDTSWRPPFPRPKPGEEPAPAADRWKEPGRRLSQVMSRYAVLRETAPDSYSGVLDEVEATGAFFLVQVLRREEPAFEEMTLAQRNQVRRVLNRERLGDLAREISYDTLRERLSLLVDGKPAAESKAEPE